MSGAPSGLLDDLEALTALCRGVSVDAGATELGVLAHHFDPQGVSVVVMLAESHVSLHTWPEDGCAYVDAFTCGDVDPAQIVGGIVGELGGVVELRDVSRAGVCSLPH